VLTITGTGDTIIELAAKTTANNIKSHRNNMKKIKKVVDKMKKI